MKLHWSGTAPAPCADTLHQHPCYGQVLQAMGADLRWATVLDGAQHLASAQLLFRKPAGGPRVAFLPAAPVWHAALTWHHRQHVMRLLCQTAPLTINVAATLQDDADFAQLGYLPVMTPQTRALLDLRPDPARLRAAQFVKWRNRLGHAERASLEICHASLPPDPNHWLLRAESAQRRANRYRALPLAFATNFAQLFPQECQLFTARTKNRTVAAMLMLRHGQGATYHIGWSDPEGRALSAHNLLLWRAALWLKGQGCHTLDLGPIDTETGPGLARFKLGCGAAPLQSGHTWLHTAPTTALTRGFAALGPKAAA